MYSTPYDVSDRMAGLFVGRRPDTLIGAPREDSVVDHHHHHHPQEQQLPQTQQQLYANDPISGLYHPPRSRTSKIQLDYPTTTTMMMDRSGMYQKRAPRLQSGMFNRLTDGLALKIFSYLETTDLLMASQVCKRFETLCWNSTECWRTIQLKSEMRGDKVLRTIFKRLLGGPSLHFIERIHVSNGCRLTDKSLGVISRRCPELTHLQVQCSEIYDSGVTELLHKCANLQHLDLTGCLQVANFCAGIQRRLSLQYLDLTDCLSIDDCCLQDIVRHCPALCYLYLRRCNKITGEIVDHLSINRSC